METKIVVTTCLAIGKLITSQATKQANLEGVNMSNYTLIAELPGDCRTVEFEAGSDEDAMFYAIDVIMANANGNKGPWATGYIELTGPGGYVVETMEEKD
jgi:hypothetical protein